MVKNHLDVDDESIGRHHEKEGAPSQRRGRAVADSSLNSLEGPQIRHQMRHDHLEGIAPRQQDGQQHLHNLLGAIPNAGISSSRPNRHESHQARSRSLQRPRKHPCPHSGQMDTLDDMAANSHGGSPPHRFDMPATTRVRHHLWDEQLQVVGYATRHTPPRWSTLG